MKQSIGRGPSKFPVLDINLFPEADQKFIRAELAKYRTPVELLQLANDHGFAKTSLDPRGRCQVISYKGVEVALLFRRGVTEVELGTIKTTPGVMMSDVEEAWLRVDLLDVKEGKLVHAVSMSLGNTQFQLQQARATLEHMSIQADAQTIRINQLERTIEELKATIKEKGYKAPPKRQQTVTKDPPAPPVKAVPVKQGKLKVKALGLDPRLKKNSGKRSK